jgi:hypothetical protein
MRRMRSVNLVFTRKVSLWPMPLPPPSCGVHSRQPGATQGHAWMRRKQRTTSSCPSACEASIDNLPLF